MTKCYYCENCNFKTGDKYMYSIHLKRGKHLKRNKQINEISIMEFLSKLNIKNIDKNVDKGVILYF